MSFIREILKSLPANLNTTGFQIVLIDGAAYFEGIRILKVSPEQMVFSAKGKKINIEGNDLHIVSLEGDSVLVSGIIKMIDLGGSNG